MPILDFIAEREIIDRIIDDHFFLLLFSPFLSLFLCLSLSLSVCLFMCVCMCVCVCLSGSHIRTGEKIELIKPDEEKNDE